MKTFKELEQSAYMSNLPEIAAIYAQLDDNEQDENEIERLNDKIHDLEMDYEYSEDRVCILEDKVETLENKLGKIQDLLNE
jgi:predicted nuclease with TOPRIM domain